MMEKSEFVEVFRLAHDLWEEGGFTTEFAGILAVDLYRRGWRKPSHKEEGEGGK